MKAIVTSLFCTILLALPAVASALEIFCSYGPKPQGRIGPSPTHMITIGNTSPWINYLAIGVFLDSEDDSHDQYSGPLENQFPVGLGTRLLNIKRNAYSDDYRCEWEVRKYKRILGPVGTSTYFELGIDHCTYDDHKYMPYYRISTIL